MHAMLTNIRPTSCEGSFLAFPAAICTRISFACLHVQINSAILGLFYDLHYDVLHFLAPIVASAGETDRDLAWTQLAQKMGVYNIIEFEQHNIKAL